MIDQLLSDAHLALTDLDAIAYGRGPGSFTGVRLAATVTQGLAFAADRRVVPISDLQAVAQRAFALETTGTRVLVCNDARMSEVYWACYERDEDGFARLEGEERVSKPSEVRLPPSWSTATAVGRGFIAYGDTFKTTLPQVLSRPPSPTGPAPPAQQALAPESISPTRLLPRASEIALLAVPLVSAGQLLPPDAATPVYLRDNVAHVAQIPKDRG
jgi:tRNA threonylcarbamoyladenosine biosynthesis protein TsaB